MKRVKPTGFTLVELLISIAIFSILVVGFYMAFSVGILAHLKEEQATQDYENARLVLNKFAMEFQNALYTNNLGLGGKATEVYFYLNPESPSIQSPTRVTYIVKKSAEGVSLLRYEVNWAEAFGEEPLPLPKRYQEMAFKMDDVKFEYFKREFERSEEKSLFSQFKKEEVSYIWVDSWSRKDGFPLGIKVLLDYPEKSFVRQIPSPFAKQVIVESLEAEKEKEALQKTGGFAR